MVEKVVGAMAAAGCLLFGGFLTLASLFALRDGTNDAMLLCALLTAGVAIIAGGWLLMWRISRPRAVKRAPRTVEDESW